MSNSGNSPDSPTNSETERDRLGRRIREMRRVLEDVESEQTLAIHRAARIGVPSDLLARWTFKKVDEIDKLVAELNADPDFDEYEEGPRWIETWPGGGWASGGCWTAP
jgi:hypothetical protein